MNRNKAQGFTLIELVVSLTILMVVGSLVFNSLLDYQSISKKQSGILNLSQKGTPIIYQFKREILNAQRITEIHPEYIKYINSNGLPREVGLLEAEGPTFYMQQEHYSLMDFKIITYGKPHGDEKDIPGFSSEFDLESTALSFEDLDTDFSGVLEGPECAKVKWMEFYFSFGNNTDTLSYQIKIARR